MTRAPLKIRSRAANESGHDIETDDLTFSRKAMGGYATASFTVPQPINSADLSVHPMSLITIYDGRNGGTAWQGYLDLPDKQVDPGGQAWQVDATGPVQLLSDQVLPYIMIDNTFSPWERLYASNAAFSAGPDSSPLDEEIDAIVCRWSNGVAIDNGTKVSCRYDGFEKAGQFIGGFGITHVEGFASTNNRSQVLTRAVPPGSYTAWLDDPLTTSPVTHLRGAGTIGTDQVAIAFRLYRNAGGATTTTTDLNWTAATMMRVKALLHDLNGSAITTTGYYDPAYVLAHQVVTDALTRYTTLIDIPNASIDTTFAYQIDQMAYPDPVRFVDILNDLALLEPDLIYEVLQRVSGGGHQFNLRRWPTDVRYEASMADGWRQTGGEADYRNKIIINGTDVRGRKVSTPITTVVPELDQWNRVRSADAVDLGSELWSVANAAQIGATILSQANAAAISGTLTVARPIRDLYRGCYVEPFEIEPGYNMIIRGLDSEVLPIQEMAFTGSSYSSALTIGRPVLTTDQIVNRLHKTRTRAAIGK
jgi:hypothetical protein